MISREELQARLRIFGSPLDQCLVVPRSQHVFTQEHEANVQFIANLYGDREVVDAEIDLRAIKDEQGILNLVSQLTQAMHARIAAKRG